MSIKAYATVRLTGCNIRRFINLCTANHIKIWNLKYVSPKEYEACCSTEDIFLMKPHLKKTHTRLRSEEHTSELQSRFGISYAVF